MAITNSQSWKQHALDFLEKWEGFSAKSYKDVVGIWTIGYGRTGKDVMEGGTTDRKAEDAWLASRLEEEAAKVRLLFKGLEVPWLGPEQLAALICFQYNCGQKALASSTLVKVLKSESWTKEQVTEQWSKWNKAGGQVVKGLTNRRAAELELFFSSL
jgi:lysozyme